MQKNNKIIFHGMLLIFGLTFFVSNTKAQDELQKINKNAPIMEFVGESGGDFSLEKIKQETIEVVNQESVTILEKVDENSNELQIKNSNIAYFDENGLKINFDVYNEKYIQSGLYYAVEFLEISKENKEAVINRKVYDDEFILKEGEIIHKEIVYAFPSSFNSSLSYSINIIIGNNSKILARKTVDTLKFSFQKTTSKSIFWDIERKREVELASCVIKKSSDSNRYSVNQGIDVILDEQLVITCDVKNSGSKEIEIIPKFTINRGSIFGEEINNKSGEDNLKNILKPLEQKKIEFSIPKMKNSGAYVGSLVFKNVEIIPVYFDFIVGEMTGYIDNIRIDKDYYKKGDVAQVMIDWSILGSNRESDLWKGFFDINLDNEKGIECGKVSLQKVEAYSKKFSKIEIPISNGCSNFQLLAILKNENGDVVDNKSIKIGVNSKIIKDESNISVEKILIAFSILLSVVFLVIILFKYIKNRQNLLRIFGIFFTMGSIFFFSINDVQAGQFYLENGYSVHSNTAIFKYNLAKTTYNPGEKINISASYEFSVGGHTFSPLIMSAAMYAKASFVNSMYQVLGDSQFPNFPPIYYTCAYSYCSSAKTLEFPLAAPSAPGNYQISFMGCIRTDNYNYDNGGPFCSKWENNTVTITVGTPLPAPTIPTISGPKTVNVNSTAGFDSFGSTYAGEKIVYDMKISGIATTYRSIPLMANNSPRYNFKFSFAGYNAGDVVQLTSRACDESGTSCSAWTAPYSVTVAAAILIPTISGPTEVSINTRRYFTVSGSTYSSGEIYYRVRDNLDGVNLGCGAYITRTRMPNQPAIPPPSYEFGWSFSPSFDTCTPGFSPGDTARLYAQACTASGVCSAWSAPFNVKISLNRPPTCPTLDGPTVGYVGTPYFFTVSGSTDPDGDKMYYGIGYSNSTLANYCMNTHIAGHSPITEGDWNNYLKCMELVNSTERSELFNSPKSVVFQKTFTSEGVYSVRAGTVDDPWGSTLDSCSNTKSIAISNSSSFNGVCGSDNGKTLSVAPTNLCSLGTPDPVVPTLSGNTWSWLCRGSDNTVIIDDVNCSTQKNCTNGTDFSYICSKVTYDCTGKPCGSSGETLAVCLKKDDCSGIMTSTAQSDCGLSCTNITVNCPACKDSSWKEVAP